MRERDYESVRARACVRTTNIVTGPTRKEGGSGSIWGDTIYNEYLQKSLQNFIFNVFALHFN